MLIPLNKIFSRESPQSVFQHSVWVSEIWFPFSSQSSVMLSTEDDLVATGKNREPYALGIYDSAATAPDWLL